MNKIITIFLYSIFIILLCIIANALFDTGGNTNRTCISEIKLVDTYKDDSERIDYYYVYGFNKSEGCYNKLAEYAKKLQLDTSRDHLVEFFMYSKYLPDGKGIYPFDLHDGKYNDYLLMFYCFTKKDNSKEIIYFDDGGQTKFININEDRTFIP